MTTVRKTLGISRAGAPKADVTAGFAATGARLDRLRERARDLRRHPTDAQRALWEELSGAKLGGVKFTRQAVVGSTIVDFACPSRWIVISLADGNTNAEVDALQDRKLVEVGVRVLRFDEAEVLANIEPVVAAIVAEVNKPFDKRRARSQFAPQGRDALESAEG